MRGDGRRSPVGRSSAWTWIHVAFSESRRIFENQAHDPLCLDVSIEGSCWRDNEDAQTQRSRRDGARSGLQDMSHKKASNGTTPLRQSSASMWPYVRPYGWALALSLFLVAVVGLLEAITPFRISMIFDTELRASTVPTLPL